MQHRPRVRFKDEEARRQEADWGDKETANLKDTPAAWRWGHVMYCL